MRSISFNGIFTSTPKPKSRASLPTYPGEVEGPANPAGFSSWADHHQPSQNPSQIAARFDRLETHIETLTTNLDLLRVQRDDRAALKAELASCKKAYDGKVAELAELEATVRRLQRNEMRYQIRERGIKVKLEEIRGRVDLLVSRIG
ncbi:hypothetical protein CspHIS471_0410140 [Cutaneotrichosporon sp. HIS471]|nr:hypothetical protein CspHIS471_0410140 [Cutaneotrichosporon sp. HIS471]